MAAKAWDRRFFGTTRGRLVMLLRRAARTVDELAEAVDLTDNAVRAHLLTLERDGLVQQQGVRRGPGSGKPAFAYGLTPEAEALFPKAYGEMLRQLLAVLSERLSREEVQEVLHELAGRLAEGHRATGTPAQRVAAAVSYLGQLGGLAECEARDGGYRISGCSCPVGEILPGNPDACTLAEMVLAEITGLPVQEHCEKQLHRCEFEITA
ncbi:MAG: ArsR family transcriptional regulator [Chloroflexota bacterium]|nr:ArsR family transcriptional regulator [Chloroflexota bacterium]